MILGIHREARHTSPEFDELSLEDERLKEVPFGLAVAAGCGSDNSTGPNKMVPLTVKAQGVGGTSSRLVTAPNMAAAAVKAVPLGQSAGQRILGRLAAEMPAAVDQALALADDERQAFSPMLAVLSARHENQYSRLFRS